MQTDRIEKEDGRFRWRYEMSLFKNPTVFLNVAKALLIAVAITMVIIGFIFLIADGFSAESFKFFGKLTLIMLGIFAVLLVLGYLLYAAIMGGNYVVDFEMDDKILIHAQCPKQAKKAKAIGAATVVAGMLAHNRGAVSAGFNAAARSVSSVEFDSVKKVVVDKKRSVIKLRSIGWNEAYADGEDFDFVADWISSHIPEKAELVVKE
ncbi:MAG: hypothetical protein K6G56_02200 [Clostridiales bacterium]|nr:hypothetical protein [Clostridiales bacterium]